MLQALISYFPEKEQVAGVGALSYSVEDRKKIAVQSRKFKCPQCGPIANLLLGGEKIPSEKENNTTESKGNELPEQQQQHQNVSNDKAEPNQPAAEDFGLEALSPEQRELLMKNDISEFAEETKVERSQDHAELEAKREKEQFRDRVEIEEEDEEEKVRETNHTHNVISPTKTQQRPTRQVQKESEDNDVPPLIEYSKN